MSNSFEHRKHPTPQDLPCNPLDLRPARSPGTVFCDQSYWQGAIAARPSATYKGYLLGGIAWFAIPFSMATTLGLAGRALDLPITMDESAQGLVPPAVAVHLLGPGGAFLVTLQLFMAVTATGSAEQIAVASLFAYDVYKRYLKPNVTGKELVFVSRVVIVAWGVVSGLLSIILLEMEISLGWVYQAMGVLIGSAVCPIAFSLLWKDCTAAGAISGALVGLFCAIVGWFSVAAHHGYGLVTVESLGNQDAFLCGNILALLVSPIVAVAVSLRAPQNYNWEDLDKTTRMYLINDDGGGAEEVSGAEEDSQEAMTRAYRYTIWTGGVLSVILIVVWPLCTLPFDVFSRSYFAFWVAIAFIWGHLASFITVLLPVWEARDFLLLVIGVKKLPPSDGIAMVDMDTMKECEGKQGTTGEVPGGSACLEGNDTPVANESETAKMIV